VILVGIGGALFGSLFGTLLTISHERAAEFRAHMLNAADDFSTGAITALHELRSAAGEIKKDEAPLDDPKRGGSERRFGLVSTQRIRQSTTRSQSGPAFISSLVTSLPSLPRRPE
jgi:hypothetical protein